MSSDPGRLRGEINGLTQHGRILAVQLPKPGSKSTRLTISNDNGNIDRIYASVQNFSPDDLLDYEGYDITYTTKEIDVGQGPFTVLSSWQPI